MGASHQAFMQCILTAFANSRPRKFKPMFPNRSMSHLAKFWLPVILWMGVIFFMSTDAGSAAHTSRILEPLLRWCNPHISAEGIERAHHIVRKCGHLSEYAMLGILCWRALMLGRPAATGSQAVKCAIFALLLSAMYAATDEFHQSFIPSRGPSVRDVMIDSCGAMIGLTVLLIWRGCRIRLARHP